LNKNYQMSKKLILLDELFLNAKGKVERKDLKIKKKNIFNEKL